MRQTKPRKYAVILQRSWGQGKYPLGVVLSTSIKAAHAAALNTIAEVTRGTDIRIKTVDRLTVRPWHKVSFRTRRLLIASGVRF